MKAVVCCRYDPPEVVEVVELASQADNLLVAQEPDASRRRGSDRASLAGWPHRRRTP